MCLEEMLGVPIAEGTLFYGKTRRRVAVELREALRQTTRRAATRLHDIVTAQRTPLAKLAPKCRRCSLKDICMPEILFTSVRRGYLAARAREVQRIET